MERGTLRQPFDDFPWRIYASRVRWLPSAVCSLVLALAVCPAAQAACNPAMGSTYNVTDPGDADVGGQPAPGTLRYVVKNASPGSAIGFCENFLIQLNGPLKIPEGKAGLQLLGPSTIAEAAPHNAFLEVGAPNVTLRGLSFTNVNITATRDAHGLAILGNQISVLNPQRDGKGSAIDLEGRPSAPLRGIQIGSKAEPNTIVSSQKAGIASEETRGLQIVGNAIDASAGNFATDDEGSSKLLIESNTVSGVISGDIETGRIAKNSVTSKPVLGIRMVAKLDRYGRVTIEDNTVSGGGNIRLERDLVEVVGNKVTGARQPGILARCNAESGNPVGPTRIADNVLEGNEFGLLFDCPRNAARGTIEGNRVTGNRKAGLAAKGTDLKVTGNTAEANRAQGLVINAPWGDVALSGNKVTDNRDIGVQFRSRSRAVMTGGQVSGNGKAGTRVDNAARVRISKVEFGGNAGPGIDLLPVGVTPNGSKKLSNENIDWPSYKFSSGKLKGRACPRCIVEAFAREDGNRSGNPRNGEGVRFIASVAAKANGSFTYPASGRLSCADAKKLTFTATDRRGDSDVTSEFSEDPKCAAPDDPGTDGPPDDGEQTGGCSGDGTVAITVVAQGGSGEAGADTEIPPDCDLGFRSDGRQAKFVSIRLYDANDSSKLYFCQDGTDPPPGEEPCSSIQPDHPPDADVSGGIYKDGGKWRLLVHVNSRPDQTVAMRAHYGWKGT